MRVGDYVVRKSYQKDVLFRIDSVDATETADTIVTTAKLKGISYRIIADAPLVDLELVSTMRFTSKENSSMELIEASVRGILAEHAQVQTTRFQKNGTVLHVDGDVFYLNICLRYYEILGIEAVGVSVSENQQAVKIKELILKYNPDILVLTGHDSLLKSDITNEHHRNDINNYRNSKNFIDAVKAAREVRPSSQQLVIYAGACQSHFEQILQAGADYASSPSRVLIHALDPTFIVERIAYCPFHTVLPIEEALKYTLTKFKGLGGFDTLGKSRTGGPVIKNLGETKLPDSTTERNLS